MDLRGYDVERDIIRARATREKRMADGLLPSPEEQRLRGGIPISDRAAVLIEHVTRSHIEAAVVPMPPAQSAALNCVRRLIEYIGALEHVLDPFTHEPWDDPRTMLGLAAAALEGIASAYEAHDDPALRNNAVELKTLAARLRAIEQRINWIPGVTVQAKYELPAVEVAPDPEGPS